MRPAQKDGTGIVQTFHHGDYEIIVLCPSSVQEMYDFTIRSFNLSERFRTPVILLSDEIVGHMREKVIIGQSPSGETPDLPIAVVSPSEDFYTGASTMVEGQLHDDQGRRIGHLATQSGDFIQQLCAKIQDHMEEIADIETYFMEDSDIAILAYGSVARPALNAVKQARGVKDTRISSRFKILRTLFSRGVPAAIQSDYSHLKVGLIKINTVWPFPQEALEKVAAQTKLIIVPEMNMGKYSREVERVLRDKVVVSMGWTIFLMNRWSCSTMLFRYFVIRCCTWQEKRPPYRCSWIATAVA